ncbi:methylglyoxal synthase [Salinimonas chungwhensis]|uniref:methylglyoxal synthase n=1 Tax=Salinimonas chungwhensis TaxID=265425 RepID=UPI00036834A6|nr:methylglyoxal synthase [Salinimonas chungwhensis]
MLKRIALVAHDHKKNELLTWINKHLSIMKQCDIVATGTTGQRINEETGLTVQRLKSGPLGGDQQIGAKIAEGELDALFFFWDPLNPAPHDPDVKALLRLCSVWNIPVACTSATADLIVTSPLFLSQDFTPEKPAY